MKDISTIEEYKLHPKVAKVLVVVMITSSLLGFYKNELSLPDIVRMIAFTISIICMCCFVLPQANIWQKIKK